MYTIPFMHASETFASRTLLKNLMLFFLVIKHTNVLRVYVRKCQL